MVLGEKFNGKVVFEKGDVGVVLDTPEQSVLNFASSEVLRMDNAAS